LFAPSATPKPIIEKLNAALRGALAEPKVVKSFEQTNRVHAAGSQQPALLY